MQAFRPETRTLGSGSGSNLNRWKNDLKTILDGIQTHGEVATRKEYARYANPGLQIGDTLITLPLDPEQVPLIRNASRQAPFGRGDETLIDTSVRNTWEIDTSGFRILNPAWAPFIADVVKDVSRSLGLPGARADLYKLLLYEEGSFFKRHKDSEKAPGMMATLSICLPSRHKGGEVHLSHAGRNFVFETSQSIFDLFALAWYADVTHEIKPIVEGHRLVLIYNIIRTGSSANSADFLAKQNQKLDGALAKSNVHFPVPQRLLYFLEHKYSRTSLRLDHLKGRDRAICLALQAACVHNGWYLFLGNVTKRSGDYGFDEDEDDDDFKGPKLAVDTVATCRGEIFASDVELDEKDILGPNPYSSRRADSESAGEDTGNEGSTIEYRYHDSTAIIIPKDQLNQFFDFDIKMKVLIDLVVDDYKACPKDPATRESVISFLSNAVDKSSTMSPIVLTLAWCMKEDSLFRTAVRKGFSLGVPENGVIPALVGLVKDDPVRPIDWTKRFGEFVSSHRSLSNLSRSLNFIEGSLKFSDLQTSFQEWRATIQLLLFETRRSLKLDDHDAIMELMAYQWDNVDWIRNVFLPKVRDCSNTKFLSAFICSLLEKDREGALDGAKDMAITLLETKIQALKLATIKFDSQGRDHKDHSECSRFTELLYGCLISGLHQFVDELLRLSLVTINAAPTGGRKAASGFPLVPHNPTLADEMLYTMCEDFEESKMPPSGPARDFVIAVLRKFVLVDLPFCPRMFQGHTHRPRGCGSCRDCEELDAFLASPTEREREFLKDMYACSHLQLLLPPDIFQCTLSFIEQDGDVPLQPVLKVLKLNRQHQAAVERYKQEILPVLDKIRPFRTEYMRNLLGTEAYAELVMLQQVPHAGEVELNNKDRSQVGSKRAAQGGIQQPASKR
ncbi:hypothetical protein F4861DRAFT_498656 [Xylaria intraflava]|nr:hypothetical protein F4861DRAFT_498656 [Xylaria intraflava]